MSTFVQEKLNKNLMMVKEKTLVNKTDLSKIPIEKSWSFADKTIKDTSYITHGKY